MKKLVSNIKRIIFDESCVGCGRPVDLEVGHICKKCTMDLKKTSAIKKANNMYYLWEYNNIIRSVISNFKFRRIHSLSDEISDIVFEKLFHIIEIEDIDTIIPVPISKKRKIERGFNQTEEVLFSCGVDFIKTQRIKDTKHMFKLLSETKRRSNIENSFKIDEKLIGKKVLIFDDIITTGATYQELRKKIAKMGNVEKVIGFFLARGKYNKIVEAREERN